MNSDLRALWASAGGRVPDEWSVVPLESLLRDSKSIAVGVMYPGPETPGGVPLIKVGDIKGGAIIGRPSFCISPETNHEYRRTQLQGDELLITLVGNPGECVVVQPHMVGWNPARAIAAIRLSDPTLRTYLKTVLESSAGKHLIDAVLNTTVQKTLNLKDIKRLPIPLPPPVAIEGITQVAETLSARIALLRETNATLEAIAQALFKSWFVDFDPVRAKMAGRAPEGMDEATAALFPDALEETELGAVPKGWRVGKVSDLGDVVCGKTPPTSCAENYGGDVPFITIPDMHGLLAVTETARSLSRQGADSQAKKYLPAGAVCVSCIATPGLVVQVTTPSQTNQQINSVIPFDLWGEAFPLFLLRRVGGAVRMGGSGGSVFHNLSKSGFEAISVLLPSHALAQAFNDYVEPLIKRVVENQRQVKVLSDLRDTLLPRLISGQLRLPEAQAQMEAIA